MLTEAELHAHLGRDVVDPEGKTIGQFETFFRDRETGQPEWLGVFFSGLFRPHHRLAPVRGAERDELVIRVPWTKDRVEGAPRYSNPEEAISEELEGQAYRHYGLERAAV